MGLRVKRFWQTLQSQLASGSLLRRSSEPPPRSWKASRRRDRSANTSRRSGYHMQSCTLGHSRTSSSACRSCFAFACIIEALTHASVDQRPFGFDFANGKVTIPGFGDTPITFTGGPDVARYIGWVFTNLPAEKLEWKVFRLEGERTVGIIHIPVLLPRTERLRSLQTFNAIMKSYQDKTGKVLEINHIPPSELEKRSDLVAIITLCWEKGEGVVGDPLDNDLYPGWNPKKALEYIA